MPIGSIDNTLARLQHHIGIKPAESQRCIVNVGGMQAQCLT
ncbi:MAG: hypothetical protein SPE63_05200 [Prevotella sp.]|nr:hypothetical protein [Prevotella sp.]